MMGDIQIVLENNIKIALAILACLLICKVTRVRSVRVKMLLMSLVWVRIMIPFSIKFNVSSTTSDVLTKAVNTGTANSQTLVFDTFFKIWCAGVVLLSVYNILVIIRFKSRLSTSIPKQILVGNRKVKVYKNDYIESGLVYGLIKTKVYISSRVEDEDIEYLYEHESMHIRRKHHIIKVITGIMTLIYWYNPLVLIFYNQYAECIELVCDYDCCNEHMDEAEWSKNYANILLKFAQTNYTNKVRVLGFGSTTRTVRKRISNVMNGQKATISNKLISIPVFILIMVALFLKPEIHSIEVNNESEEVHKKSVLDYNAELPKVIKGGTNGKFVQTYMEIDEDGNIIYDYMDE